ncbi:carbohydrate ABC transporter permease [Halalkalibacter sp. APA_J-10(15)]|uniref:carbohydrate ABC transporter permease n=1 Tax=unclassified Halalkalibacter TaxID=2893063 RepID=UPI001FF585CE|nr:sugar ABC transporter permease [Halalkalibacter sp. APA_J-10(15)]MCK0472849.1 sugar ABC transporter permease [Halalkalibacter sp. APA_J-10(15)]
MNTVLRDRKAILAFVGPALLIYLVVLFVPIAWSIGYSFFEGSPIRGFEFVGITNYVEIFRDQTFWNSLWLSVRYAFFVTSGQIVFGLLFGLIFVFYIKRFSSLFRTLIFFPMIIPAVAVAQLFTKLFEIAPQFGLVNSIFDALHLDMLVQAWLGQGETAFWVIVLMDIWRAVGFYAVIFYAGLIDVPEDVLEAAKLDGASGFTLIGKVVLPLIRPILISGIIFSLNGTLKVFESVVALTNGGPGNSTQMLTLYMYNTAFSYNQYGYGSTIAVFLLLFCLGVTLLVYRLARKDV